MLGALLGGLIASLSSVTSDLLPALAIDSQILRPTRTFMIFQTDFQININMCELSLLSITLKQSGTSS